ncbi:carbonic anhydrase [Paraphysoderma sedebokerense]|nr:carbonic anhydrase [Paraphysoderma sedebokerense]
MSVIDEHSSYPVPNCPNPDESTPTRDSRLITDPKAELAPIPPLLSRESSFIKSDIPGRLRAKSNVSEYIHSQEDSAHGSPLRLIRQIPTTFSTLNNLLEANKIWAATMVKKNGDFFTKLANQQSPQVFWIGCSDSRVPANQIVNLQPGEVFVHRNIANVVTHTDINCLSVLQYAVDVLKVKHIIVCGHYGCGGVVASMCAKQYGLIDNWLRNIKDLYAHHVHDLEGCENEKAKADLMCELNVANSVRNVCATTIVQNAWARNQELSVHGWCYRIEDGLIRDLGLCISDPSMVEKVYQMIKV